MPDNNSPSLGLDFESRLALLKHRLEADGLTVLSIVEPDSAPFAKVNITDSIFVMVPKDGGPMVVVLVHDEGFRDHGRPRKRIGNVVDDVSCAIHQGTPRP